jgi:acetate---CoA ligase (ADP-forming)
MDYIHVRPITRDDQPRLVDFYASLSPESRRTRFLGTGRGIGTSCASVLCGPDHVHEEGFVAVEHRNGPVEVARVVGHVCIVDAGPGRSELAVAVADQLQGRGIGRRLVNSAIAWAHAAAITTVTASAFADNWRVIRLLTESGYETTVLARGCGLVDITADLTRSAARRAGTPTPHPYAASRRTQQPVPAAAD